MGAPMFPPLGNASAGEAMRFGERALSYRELRDVAASVARRIVGRERVAVWAPPCLETCAGVVGALAAGVPVVPVNPKSGTRELEQIVADSSPESLLCPPGTAAPDALAALERVEVELEAPPGELPHEPGDEHPATSSTRRVPPVRPRGRCCRRGRSPRTLMPSRRSGSRPSGTSSSTRCRSSLSTA
jgi:malonyl-CoA/methylmalonyl-CoA synthetase